MTIICKPYQPPAPAPQKIETVHMIHRAAHGPKTSLSHLDPCKAWGIHQLHPATRARSQTNPEKGKQRLKKTSQTGGRK
jgi:hypothetical protein